MSYANVHKMVLDVETPHKIGMFRTIRLKKGFQTLCDIGRGVCLFHLFIYIFISIESEI